MWLCVCIVCTNTVPDYSWQKLSPKWLMMKLNIINSYSNCLHKKKYRYFWGEGRAKIQLIWSHRTVLTLSSLFKWSCNAQSEWLMVWFMSSRALRARINNPILTIISLHFKVKFFRLYDQTNLVLFIRCPSTKAHSL